MNWKNVVLVVAVVAVGAIALLSFFQGGGGTDKTVTTNLSIEFFGAPDVTIHKGNITTWAMVNGEWAIITTEAQQDGNTTWTFQGIIGRSNCYDPLLEAARIAGTAVAAENQTMGTMVISIDGVSNMEFEARGWQYYVNGTYGNKACNLYALEEGDSVVWKYNTNQFSG